MKQNLTYLQSIHTKTPRNYVGRVTESDKAECAKVAKKFGKDYWDGERKYGYGGYHYDGRWAILAQKLVQHYGLTNRSKVLDVGCGKGFLLYEIKKILPQCEVVGVDISEYAIRNSKEEVRDFLSVGNATQLPFENGQFDLVISITTLHNLYINDLVSALKEIQRVSKKDSYVVVESYRNENEKVNLLYWQLTCESFFTPEEWVWIFDQYGYQGDYEFIYFE